jgi:hypothetical protein
VRTCPRHRRWIRGAERRKGSAEGSQAPDPATIAAPRVRFDRHRSFSPRCCVRFEFIEDLLPSREFVEAVEMAPPKIQRRPTLEKPAIAHVGGSDGRPWGLCCRPPRGRLLRHRLSSSSSSIHRRFVASSPALDPATSSSPPPSRRGSSSPPPSPARLLHPATACPRRGGIQGAWETTAKAGMQKGIRMLLDLEVALPFLGFSILFSHYLQIMGSVIYIQVISSWSR